MDRASLGQPSFRFDNTIVMLSSLSMLLCGGKAGGAYWI